MRKINTRDFHVARRTTSRDINRRIALNLIREHQPISRADLARRLKMTRGVISILVQELIAQGVIYEGATGEAARGRKPTSSPAREENVTTIGDARGRRLPALPMRPRNEAPDLAHFPAFLLRPIRVKA